MGLLEEGSEAERHDGEEFASPLVKVLKMFLSYSAASNGNESDITPRKPPVLLPASPLHLSSDLLKGWPHLAWKQLRHPPPPPKKSEIIRT